MPTNSLDLAYRRFLQSSAWLQMEFNRELAAFRTGKLSIKSFSLSPEMATLRLHDDWARCCREIVLASAVDEPTTITGTVLAKAPGIATLSDAVRASIQSTSTRRYEPKWATAREAIAAAVHLRIANLATVTAAVGATNSPAEDLRHVRNFFAHRAENTAAKVRALSFFAPGMSLNAADLLWGPVLGGVSRFESWIFGLRAIASAAIQ